MAQVHQVILEVIAFLFCCTAVAGQIGVTLCGCQPAFYEITLNFNLTDNMTTVGGPGINETAVLTGNTGTQTNTTDKRPVMVTQVTVTELGELELPVNSVVLQDTNLYDGDTFTYTSILSLNASMLNETFFPTGLQIILEGITAEEVGVVNTMAITYDNTCGVFPILKVGQHIGWNNFTFLGDPPSRFCPLVPSDAPSVIPTMAPSVVTLTPQPPATLAPTSKAPVTAAPATKAPATAAPATKAPATAAPATKAPATEMPATTAPATEMPATTAPATEMPVTETPVSPTPVSASPTTIPISPPANPTPEPVPTCAPFQRPPTSPSAPVPSPSAPVPSPSVPAPSAPNPSPSAPTAPNPSPSAPHSSAPVPKQPPSHGSGKHSGTGKSGSGKSGKSSSPDNLASKKKHIYYGSMDKLKESSSRRLRAIRRLDTGGVKPTESPVSILCPEPPSALPVSSGDMPTATPMDSDDIHHQDDPPPSNDVQSSTDMGVTGSSYKSGSGGGGKVVPKMDEDDKDDSDDASPPKKADSGSSGIMAKSSDDSRRRGRRRNRNR